MECLIEFGTMHAKWGKRGNRQTWNEGKLACGLVILN